MKKKESYYTGFGYWKWTALFGIFVLAVTCQKESIEIIDEREDQNLVAQSELNTMMHNIALHDGSFDDHIDGANCFSIQFPYRILFNNKVVDLESKEALQAVGVRDQIALIFPVVIAHSDHTTTVLNSQAELEAVAQKCTPNADPDIECIDFEYPITIATFNPLTNQMRTLEINHDVNLYQLTLELIEDSSMRIQYPLTLRLYDGTELTAKTNEELKKYIMEFEQSCDELD